VQLAQVAASLGEVLPEGREPGEVYELREAGGRIYQQKKLSLLDRTVSARAPLITVPISEGVLPGWEVAGFLAETPHPISNKTLFTLSAVLAGALVVAILAGGTLLMREARRNEEEAAQKTSFVANVSHEFKTPLTTIRLYAELLDQGRVTDAGKRTDYLRTIARETQRLARLVNNVLDFSRLEQGKKRLDLRPLNLADELVRLLDAQAPRLAEMGMTLRREFPAEPLVVTTDRDALEQILLNLLDNACKYAALGGEVTVSLALPGAARSVGLAGGKPAHAEVKVADRGPGVSSAHQARIFEKFHRADDTLTAEKGGAGLGLSIARQLARGLGGELTYVERPGGGAEFVLTLP
jgi:signal transduction histidine kinase